VNCLRTYSTSDGRSHFDEVDIPTRPRQVHPDGGFRSVSKICVVTRQLHTHSGRRPAGRLARCSGTPYSRGLMESPSSTGSASPREVGTSADVSIA
jgi:hypothetical protein